MNDFRKWFSYKWKKWRSDAPSIRKMDRARAKKETGRRYIKHLILFPVVLIYLELMLKLLTGTGMFTHFIFPVLFGISAGLFFGIITSFLKAKTNRVLRIILLILLGVFYGLEFFMKQVFGVYMPLITIINGTGGIANDFLGYAIGVILKGIPVIILVMLPAAWYILFGRRVVPSLRLKPKKMLLPAIICVVLFFVTLIFASTGKPGLIYTSRYSYDSATEYFGLQTGLRLDIKYSIFGNKAARALIIEEQESTEEAETSPAESENNAPVITGDNVMNLPLDELNASTGDSEVREMNAYVASLKPSNKNAYTGLFKGKNLILICAESLTDVIVTPELTPTLYRLMHNGIYLSDYYQPTWGGSTVTGEFSTLTGLVPMRLEDEMSFTVGENMYFTMGNQLQRLGYFSEAYHTGSYDYYDRQSTHQNLGYDNYYGNGNGLEVLTNSDWAGDVAAMDAIVDRIVTKQPFSIYYMTISGHFPYSSDSATTEKHYDEVQAAFPDRYGDAFNYICSELELEDALTVLVEKLEAAGVADDTVICLSGDHYPYGVDNLENLYGYEINTCLDQDHNVGIIWSGCLEHDLKNMACEISAPTYSLDLLPTLSNLFGVEYDSRLLVGRDIFSSTEALVVWNSFSWKSEQGWYNSGLDEFYPSDSCTLSGDELDSYIQRINNSVANKISFSDQVIEKDYYGLLFGSDPDAVNYSPGWGNDGELSN